MKCMGHPGDSESSPVSGFRCEPFQGLSVLLGPCYKKLAMADSYAHPWDKSLRTAHAIWVGHANIQG